MKGDVEEEAPRPRPLSGGIWTLFSWLRRTDRSSSSESITSVGSDRTAASFDFFAPIHYKNADRNIVLPHTPITDSYRKRIQERNIRRQNDRDITLRRKYGLYSEELGYDAFSLPPARKVSKDSARQRRATSETIQRRAAYVPGKRRAPLPPTTVISTSLPRNYKRKRPAPKPPLKLIIENKENIVIKENLQMSSQSVHDKHSYSYDTKSPLKTKAEKAIKQDMSKDIKLRTEKSFLKQIFDNRKRNSAIDTSHVKLLPSISELDKEAAEIIQKNRALRTNSAYCDNDSIMKLAEIASSSTGTWICTICLRKYNSTVIACVYCVTKDADRKSFVNVSFSSNVTSASSQTEQNIGKQNKKLDGDEKKKLRDMLKEMKDSLPKRPKHEKINKPIILTETETPTLRIGSTIKDTNYNEILPNDMKSNKEHETNSLLTASTSSSKQIVSDIILSNIKTEKKERHKIHNNNSKLPTSSNALKIFFLNDNENKDNSELSINSNNNLEKAIFINNDVNKIGGEVIANNAPVVIQNAGKNSQKSTQSGIRNLDKPKESKKYQDRISGEIPNGVNVRAQTSTSTQNYLKSEEKVDIKKGKLRENSVLVPINEIEITSKPHDISNNKIESIRIGDVISSDRVQNLETSKSSPPSVSSTDLRTPLKISSLLNPLYLPKEKDSKVTVEITNKKKTDLVTSKSKPSFEKPDIIKPINVDSKPSTSSGELIQKPDKSLSKKCEKTIPLQVSKEIVDSKRNDINFLDHHARRRDLVNQLEQAIARGDERIAAEAAAKLAKLKLSCSVLSFSSQIVGASVIPKMNDIVKDINLDEENRVQHTQDKTITNSNVKTETKINVSPEVKPGIAKAATANENKSFNGKNTNENKTKNVNEPIPTTSKEVLQSQDQLMAIEVWVEDKEAARGPIHLRVLRKSVVRELKQEAEKALGIEIRLQRWIIGKTLCSNDNAPLVTLAGPDLNAPFYLCLVEAETKNDVVEPVNTDTNTDEKKVDKSGDFYTELMKLEQQALVSNIQEFECGVCIEQCAIGVGVVLRECIHTFCNECLRDVVRHCEEPIVTCPAIGCPGVLQEREIRALLAPEEYERWLARGLAAAESGTRNAFHCRTKDCTGWAFCEPGVRKFPCPVCKHTNCLPCQAIHEGETCEKYQARLREAVTTVEANQSDEGTQALLKSLINKGEALECPDCKAIITKKWGCDWIKCSACKTEICWVTKGRRWGPGGKGDTSAGCRCGVDGKRCHPSCGYCH